MAIIYNTKKSVVCAICFPFILKVRILIRQRLEPEERCIFLKRQFVINDHLEKLTFSVNIVDDCPGFHPNAFFLY